MSHETVNRKIAGVRGIFRRRSYARVSAIMEEHEGKTHFQLDYAKHGASARRAARRTDNRRKKAPITLPKLSFLEGKS